MESELNREYCEAQRILKAFGKLAGEVQSRAPATVARAALAARWAKSYSKS